MAVCPRCSVKLSSQSLYKTTQKCTRHHLFIFKKQRQVTPNIDFVHFITLLILIVYISYVGMLNLLLLKVSLLYVSSDGPKTFAQPCIGL